MKKLSAFSFLLVLGWLLAGCQGESPAVETVTAVTSATAELEFEPTAVPSPLPTEPPDIVPTAVPPISTSEPELVDLVMAHQAAINAGDAASVLAMYAEDIQLSDTLLTPCDGKASVSAYVDYEVGLHSRLNLTDCVLEGQTVTCRGEMTHDWQTAGHLQPFIYDKLSFTFQGEQIIEETHLLSTVTAEEGVNLLEDFKVWSMAKQPVTTKRLLTEEGLIIPNGDNAETITNLITEWMETSFLVSAEQLIGFWEAESCRWDTCYFRYMAFLEDGTGFLYLSENASTQPFDPEKGRAIQFDYWFEDNILSVQHTAGFWAESGVIFEVPGACDPELVGQFMLEGLSLDHFAFLLVDASSCQFHNSLVTKFRVWDWQR